MSIRNHTIRVLMVLKVEFQDDMASGADNANTKQTLFITFIMTMTPMTPISIMI